MRILAINRKINYCTLNQINKMKKFYYPLLLLFVFSSFKVYAQESMMSEINYNLLDKYIQSAKDHYTRHKIFDLRTKNAKVNIPMNIVSYLDLFTASYFYRPDGNTVITSPGSVVGNPYFVNGWQFGVSVNVGTYLQKPFMVKKARYDYQIAQLEEQEYDTELTMEVKRRYYDYVQQISQLKIVTKGEQDSRGYAESMRSKFEKGEATLDAYNQSRASESTANSGKLAAEVAYLKAKDSLEEIVGVKLSDIK